MFLTFAGRQTFIYIISGANLTHKHVYKSILLWLYVTPFDCIIFQEMIQYVDKL